MWNSVKALASTLLILGSPAVAEPTATSSSAAQAKAVDALLAKRHRADAPGCAIGVYRSGKILHTGAFGMANLEFGVPITPRAVFDIGSVSKQFTAASLVLLAQDGKLSLDDDIRKYLPELPDYGKKISVRHLLNHTSGLRDYNRLLSMAGFNRDDVSTNEQAYALIIRQKGLNFEPGTRHLYSNTGHFLASLIVEKVAGQGLPIFAHERIFKPLGMGSTLFRDDHTLIVPQRAVGYSPRENAGYQIDVSNWEQVGDGGLLSTVEDFARWSANLDSGAVGGKGLIDALHTRSTLRDGSTIEYTIGLQHGAVRGLLFVEHSGGWGGYVSHFRRFPAAGLTVAALCNDAAAPVLALVELVGDVYLGSPAADGVRQPVATPQPTVNLSNAQLDAWIGEYRDIEKGDLIKVERGDAVLLANGGGPTFTLRPADPSRFQILGGPPDAYAQFEVTDIGARTMHIFFGDKLFQTLQAASKSPTSTAAFANHAGNYRCDELDAVHRVEADGEGLLVRLPRTDPVRFLPFERNIFHGGPSVVLTFSGEVDGKSATFRIDTPRARGVQCDRLN